MKDNQSQKLSFEQWDTMIKEETHWDVSLEEKVFPRKKQSVKKKVNKPEKIKVENNPKENVSVARPKNKVFLDKVEIGCNVKVHDLEYDEQITYTIVKSGDANSLKNKISNDSPVGKALLGKKVGQIAEVGNGNQKILFKILEIYSEAEAKSKVRNKLIEQNIIKSGNIKNTKDISPKDFITRVNVFKCTNAQHKIIDIMCRVKIITSKGTTEIHVVPGGYCENCDKFFMLDHVYRNLKEKGTIACKVVEFDYWINPSKRKDFMNRGSESLLHMLGYNVNVQNDMPQAQRWALLELIVDEKIMTVNQICSHLQYLMKSNAKNSKFKLARLKWEADSKHISLYRSKDRAVVDVKSITSNNYIKK